MDEAARLADRSPEDFAKEELLDLARRIQQAGTTDAVELARHREADRARPLGQFLAAGDGDQALRDWGRNRRAQGQTDGTGPQGGRIRGQRPRLVAGQEGGPPPRSPNRTRAGPGAPGKRPGG